MARTRARARAHTSAADELGPVDVAAVSFGGGITDAVSAAASRRHLAGRLAVVEQRVHAATARRRATGDPSSDPFPGLVVSDAKAQRLLQVGSPLTDLLGDKAEGAREADTSDWLLSQVEQSADEVEAAGGKVRLRMLQRRFGLDDRSLDVLLVALAPELDRRFEQLYGYLNDDITRRRATVGLALELVGMSLASVPARATLGPSSPLLQTGLVALDGAERPWPGRELRVPDRVVAWCLGHDEPDPHVAAIAELADAASFRELDDTYDAHGTHDGVSGDAPAPGDAAAPGDYSSAIGRTVPDFVPSLAQWLVQHEGIVYLQEAPGASGRWLGTTTWASIGLPALACHLDLIGPDAAVADVVAAAARDAALLGAGLVAGPIDAVEGAYRSVVDALTRVPGGVIVHGRRAWDATWSRLTPMVFSVPMPTSEDLAPHWAQALHGAPLEPGLDAIAATAQFRLAPEQVARAGEVARGRAELTGATIDAKALRAGAREHNNPGLERLAQRIEPKVGWSDLVLPEAIATQLREVAARADNRETVLGRWGMRPGGRRGRGIVALFCGVSGTGKTMSAEVLAGELGIDLYIVDLSSVIDKYVGETEKNLERVFTEADGIGGVLLFDEADALFAKRSEVRGANDRYANVEVAYLLQRMERFDGLALLSTNLRANIDEAFVRRLDAVVEFPMPDAALRRSLWDRSLTPAVPRGDDLDLDFLATSFTLSGGNIHSVCLSTAYMAADTGLPVTMHAVIRCLVREYRKLGRLCTESEFGPYWSIVTE